MGFHVCEYCDSNPETSSGDVTMNFDNGHSYEAPDMLVHYVRDHEFQPPQQFVDDVLNTELVSGGRVQTRSPIGAEPDRIGYLSGEYFKGPVPDSFVEKLERVMKLAADLTGGRTQTKSPFNKPPGMRGPDA